MKIGSRIKNIDPLPGVWSCWSRADEPGSVFVTPVDDTARELGLTWACIRLLLGQNAGANEMTVIRTSPSRPDLCGTPKERTERAKQDHRWGA